MRNIFLHDLKNRDFKLYMLTISIVTLLFTICIQNESYAQSGNKPNIIIIIPDDMGWADVGYNGSEIKTPNIDKLAESGIRLDQHYVMPTCTPTRVSLMTGLYPSRYGVTNPSYGEVIDQGDLTLASLLSDNGYCTAIAGKWHMGSPPHTPLKYGFQSSYGYFDGQIDPFTHEYKNGRESWHRNDEYLTEKGHATDLITEEALRVIGEKHDKPFFLYVAYSVPHYPLDEPDKKWTSMYDDSNLFPSRKWFAASVSHMDDGIGKIIDALDKSGQRENTLILFISDNGGQLNWHSNTQYHRKYADKPHDVLGNNFPLRGWKGDLYEGGIRVPAVANWSGQLKPGVAEFPIHVSDWLPTLFNLTQCDGDEQKLKRDGQDIWTQMTENRDYDNKRVMYWKTSSETAVREGDWKLIVNNRNSSIQLYNLEKDFRETKELSESNPKIVKHLKALLKEIAKKDRE